MEIFTMYQFSKDYRQNQRVNVAIAFLNQSLSEGLSQAAIPGKIIQAGISLYGALQKNIKLCERILYITQSLISTAQIGLLLTSSFKHQECQTTGSLLCQMITIFDYLYRGFLLFSWIPCELFKEDEKKNTMIAPANKAKLPKKKSKRPSKKATRTINRTNAGLGLFSTTISSISPQVVLPIKIMQGLASFKGFFTKEIDKYEKIMHILLGTTAIVQFIIFTLLFFQGNDCEDNSTPTPVIEIHTSLCRLVMYFSLIYSGLLLTGWVPAEFFKSNENLLVADEANQGNDLEKKKLKSAFKKWFSLRKSEPIFPLEKISAIELEPIKAPQDDNNRENPVIRL